MRPGIHFHPCNTLLISYTISSSSGGSLISKPTKTGPIGFFVIYPIITPFHPLYTTSSFGDLHIRPTQIRRPELPSRPAVVPAEPASTTFGFSSLQECTKDIPVLAIVFLIGRAVAADLPALSPTSTAGAPSPYLAATTCPDVAIHHRCRICRSPWVGTGKKKRKTGKKKKEKKKEKKRKQEK